VEDETAVRKDGTIDIPEEQRARWGLAPGSRVLLRETPYGLLLRPADPPLSKIYLEPTTRCNLRCRTCLRSSWSEPEGTMPLATYRVLLEGLKTLRRPPAISFWGIGEPLLHPDIVEMVHRAETHGIETELVTNGTLLDRETADGLLTAGLARIVVSIDGVTEASHAEIRPGADLASVKNNLAYLAAARLFGGHDRPEIALEFVLMRRNLHELPRVPELARSIGASRIIVTNVMPYTEELKNEFLYGVTAAEWPHSSKRFGTSPDVVMPKIDVRSDTREALIGFFVNAGAVGPHQRSVPEPDLTAYCPFVWEGKTAVAWNGAVSPCIALMHSHTCFVLGRHKSIRRHSLGTLQAAPIVDIWNSPEYREFRRRVMAFEFAPCIQCDCDLAESNEQDCFGSPFPTCGDCLWARGAIVCP